MLVTLVFRATKALWVCGGPFHGMRYVRSSVGSSLVPKILGTYELEIAPWLMDLPHFQMGLDVGAAEGYYAVGLLKRGTCDRVTAWEMTKDGRALMAELAAANGLQDRLDIAGYCDALQLEQTLAAASGDVLLVVDCEGFEGDLLGPLSEAVLARCTLVIETHNPMNPGVHEKLSRQLAATHSVVEVFPKRRVSRDLPPMLPGLLNLFRLPVLRRLAMSERRCSGIGWLLCRPYPQA